jgi:predicted ATPase/signal transduction histidine kinase
MVSVVQADIKLDGYAVGEELYSGSQTLVYRGVRRSDRQPVVIKLLRHPHPTFNELVQFRNQHTIGAQLSHPHIIQLYDIAPYQNGYALIMEDYGGISLRQFCQIGALSLELFFEIALQICDGLHYLFQQQVIHKDIKPANILIHPDTHQVKLIDFSIASLLPRETKQLQSASELEGSLAYLSPEQTGRMNRGVDYRSDFYGLGITLYELLTGQLPYQSQDPLELVHYHIALQPVPPHQREATPVEVPEGLSAIVIKLLAKNAEDRYQSALGLKHDLQQARSLWQQTGTVPLLTLGLQDISDRFLIPETLYGRHQEVETLLAAFDRVAAGARELVLVAGFSGIGKTSVVNEVHRSIVRQRGYFIAGKFDQFQRDIPFSALVAAFRDLMAQLLAESDRQLAQWRSKILMAVGDSGQVLIEVIPELEQVIGPQPQVPVLTGSAAQNRFNRIFQAFIQAFTTPDHPLVIFIDDMQWADSASLGLIKLLLAEAAGGYLLFLAAYRDNEVYPAHPFMEMVQDLRRTPVSLTTITLPPLQESDIGGLVADTLHRSSQEVADITHLIYRQTQGNPFFANQVLKGLYEDGYIQFDSHCGCWHWNLEEIRLNLLSEDVVEFMMTRLRKLPADTQQVLKLAACIGNRFTRQTLQLVLATPEIDVGAALWPAIAEGLILSHDASPIAQPALERQNFLPKATPNSLLESQSSYSFLHDRVQQAAYHLIPEAERQGTHLTIGRLLLSHTPDIAHSHQIFEIANHWNAAIALIIAPQERLQLVRLNLAAGHKAKAANAYSAALGYLSQAIQLLPSTSWEQTYALTLELYLAAAEVAYLSTAYDRFEAFAQTIEHHSQSPLDKAQIYELKIQAYMAQLRMGDAMAAGIEGLSLLGIDIYCPVEGRGERPQLPAIAELEALPRMTDVAQLTALRILTTLTTTAYQTQTEIFRWVVLTQLELCLRHGIADRAGFAYSAYGWLCSVEDNIEQAYQAGQIALWLVQHSSSAANSLGCRVMQLVECFIRHRKEPVSATFAPLKETIQRALDTGDFEYVGYAAMNYCNHVLFSGDNLEHLSQMQQDYTALLDKYRQEFQLNYTRLWHQFTLNLQGLTPQPTELVGESCNEHSLLARFEAAQNHQSLFAFHSAKAILHSLFGEHSAAISHGEAAAPYAGSGAGLMLVPIACFHYTLALLGAATSDNPQRSVYVERAIAQHRILQAWADDCPANYGHRAALVAAELARVQGDYGTAIALYDQAIDQAKTHHCQQDVALANELAGQFYQQWSKPRIAQEYMLEAYYGYSRWGAKAKVTDLEARYANLLQPIFQSEHRETAGGLRPTSSSSRGTSSGSSTAAASLDLASILKASQTLSSEIELEGLLATLLNVVMEGAGAERCVLMLVEASDVMVEAIAQVGQPAQVMCHLPLEQSHMVPTKLINRVKRSQQPAIIIDATAHTLLSSDPYVLQRQPKSLLCLPILKQGKLLGLMYLENNLAVGVFTEDRVEVLNLLCSQAAISLENALLYQQTQAYARQLEHTVADLRQAQDTLQGAQMQLVQAEKMSALGNLVAGVAHEINNPVGFLSGNLTPAQDYIQDLLGLIDLYNQQFPQPGELIVEEIDAIDLDYVREDLPKLLASMKVGIDRIRNISTSLRTFSRADKDYKVPFNIHDGLDSTILILKHRLKAGESRPAIQVTTAYDDLPPIDCFPGQLNQVFMNILANAIDALEEANAGRSFAEIIHQPNQIEIQTRLHELENTVSIQIHDNGVGMPPAVKERIFDHLFTTKAVGKGTGLGLAIAHQIITEKHGGAIAVESTPGQGTKFVIHLPIKEETGI